LDVAIVVSENETAPLGGRGENEAHNDRGVSPAKKVIAREEEGLHGRKPGHPLPDRIAFRFVSGAAQSFAHQRHETLRPTQTITVERAQPDNLIAGLPSRTLGLLTLPLPPLDFHTREFFATKLNTRELGQKLDGVAERTLTDRTHKRNGVAPRSARVALPQTRICP
jgi:hypothetical protein